MFAYSFVVSLFVVTATLWKRWLILRGCYSQESLRERLGLSVPQRLPEGRGILINAVSVGEVAEAETLLHSLVRMMPDAEFVLTTGNSDGRVRACQLRDRLNSQLTVMYLPWDRRRQITKWLEGFRPSMLVTLETDIWPNLFKACKDLGIPVLIINARVYPKDVWRYRIARLFFGKRVLSCVNWIGVQSRPDFDRFLAIGANPGQMEVVGNLKFAQRAVVPLLSDSRLDSMGRIQDAILVAGSTHNPEERWILDAFSSLRNSGRNIRLVLAPRNVRRSVSIENLAKSKGFHVARWSAAEGLRASWDVLILDQVGWLPTIYSFSQIAVIGGTFAHKGGHNLAEAAEHGCAVVVGPSVSNFEEMVNEFDQAGGIVRTGRNDLATTLEKLLSDRKTRTRIGSIARTLLSHHSDCSARYSSAIVSQIRTASEYSIDQHQGSLGSASDPGEARQFART